MEDSLIFKQLAIPLMAFSPFNVKLSDSFSAKIYTAKNIPAFNPFKNILITSGRENFI